MQERDERTRKRLEKRLKRIERRRKWRGVRLALLSLLVAGLVFLCFGAIYVFGFDGWVRFDPDKLTDIPQSLMIFDGEGQLVETLHGAEDRVVIPLSEVSEQVRDAFLAAEDVRFYDHPGVDVVRIFGAFIADIRSGSYSQGASTISQQLIKNTHLTNDKTLTRKLQEAVMALQLEREYSKDEILELYLNDNYFGAGAYGIEAAARTYFGKHASELTLAEGALLAGVLKSSVHYAPHINPEASVKRRNLVLDLMAENDFITESEAAAAKKEPLRLNMSDTSDYAYPYYTEYVLSQAADKLGISGEELLSGGYRVYTALDTRLQGLAESLFEDESNFPEDAADGTVVQGAFVAVDAKTHEITALVGGRNRSVKLGLNRAVQSRRQPGSSIKPVLVYAPAIEKLGYSPTSILLDEQMTFGDYSPTSSSGKYRGYVTMRQAVESSLNVPAVKLLSEIGVPSAKRFAQKLGITFDGNDNGLSLALGGFTNGVTPLELCGAYAAFADGGLYASPECIRSITDAQGNVLYERREESERVMSQASAYLLTSMLASVVDEGTGKVLSETGLELAGKTGTAGYTGGKNRDAWMAAYSADIAAAVWMGFDDTDDTHCLSDKVTGGKQPAEFLSKFFSGVYEELDAPEFVMPEGIEAVRVDKRALEEDHEVVLATALTPEEESAVEVFAAGSAPTSYTEYWSVPPAPSDVRAQQNEQGYPVISWKSDKAYFVCLVYRDDALIAELSGKTSYTYTDSDAPGGEHTYYVIAAHPELVIAGERVESPKSRSVKCKAPYPLALTP